MKESFDLSYKHLKNIRRRILEEEDVIISGNLCAERHGQSRSDAHDVSNVEGEDEDDECEKG